MLICLGRPAGICSCSHPSAVLLELLEYVGASDVFSHVCVVFLELLDKVEVKLGILVALLAKGQYRTSWQEISDPLIGWNVH